MFWRDDGNAAEYEITDCWPELPEPADELPDLANEAQSLAAETKSAIQDPAREAEACCEPDQDAEPRESD